MSLVFTGVVLAANLATLCILWSTNRKLRRVEEGLDATEEALFKAEGDLAALKWEGRRP